MTKRPTFLMFCQQLWACISSTVLVSSGCQSLLPASDCHSTKKAGWAFWARSSVCRYGGAGNLSPMVSCRTAAHYIPGPLPDPQHYSRLCGCPILGYEVEHFHVLSNTSGMDCGGQVLKQGVQTSSTWNTIGNQSSALLCEHVLGVLVVVSHTNQ